MSKRRKAGKCSWCGADNCECGLCFVCGSTITHQSVDCRLRCAEARIAKLITRLDRAWGIIANAGSGDWRNETADWQAAAAKWQDECWHQTLNESSSNLPEAKEGASYAKTTIDTREPG
jgi:hypothetical protein